MTKEEIVEEVQKARQEQAALGNFDLKTIFANARRRQTQSGRRVALMKPVERKTK